MRICSASAHYLGAPLTPSESLITEIFFFPESLHRVRNQKSCVPIGKYVDGGYVTEVPSFLVVICGLKTDVWHILLSPSI